MRNRTWKTLAAAVLLGPAVALVGCKGDGDTGADAGPDNGPGVVLAEPVPIVESVSGNSQALKTIGTMLIRTQAEYDALGDANIFPGGIDFEQYDLVIVALGEQMTGGYAVEINAIQQVGDELAVTGKATRPGPDAIVTQALTYPYDAVIIANTDAKTVVPYID
ncbi:MAG: protease complex subunit PrcB family protein [Phycisphaeraceae bacterium]